ncbi:MAG TPA: AprI/Inh family metalloprotease inhibitor [Rhizomicrobium sp.]|jgi:hypothetical protein|nr:AprI/Inh family metalloprotease inhibitor [Rhizomicrobium sp.]
MNKISAFALAAGLAIAGASAAQAADGAAGTYKVKIGSSDTTCNVTLNADISATAGTANSDCDMGLAKIGNWKATGTSLKLLSPSGQIVAWVKQKGDAYTGTRITDGRKIALSPNAVASK